MIIISHKLLINNNCTTNLVKFPNYNIIQFNMNNNNNTACIQNFI